MKSLNFILIFTYKTRISVIPNSDLQNLSNNFHKNFIENLNYLYHGILHSGMLKTFWTFLISLDILKIPKHFIKSLTKPS